MVDTPKAIYDLPRARFTWYRPDTGYYLERQAISMAEDDYSNLRWECIQRDADETFAEQLWQRAKGGYGEPLLVPMPSPGRMIPTNPLEDDPLLFQEFADLNPTEEAILEFANKHGALYGQNKWLELPQNSLTAVRVFKMPQLSRKQLMEPEISDDVWESIHQGIESSIFGEPCWYWQQEIAAMLEAVELFRWWENEDTDSLKNFIVWDRNRRGNQVIRYVRRHSPVIRFAGMEDTILSEDDELFRSIPTGDVLTPALMILTYSINAELQNYPVLTKLILEDNCSKAEPYLVPYNLLSAMWLQLSQHVAREKRSKKCRICGDWEDVTNKRQMGKGWERHNKCAANVRARRSNINRKVTEAQRTGKIDEAKAREIKRELSEAKTYLALTAASEKLKSSPRPKKPAAKKQAAKKPAKKPAAKKKGSAK